jgi:glyoxylate reductase
MSNVLITRQIPKIAEKILLKGGHNLTIPDEAEQLSPDQLLKLSKQNDAVISMLSDLIDENFLKKNSHLKVISNYAVGYNNIDLKTAKRLNIPIGNTPDVLTNATADMAFTLGMAVARNLKAAWQNIEQGKWQNWEPMGFLGQELEGKTLGIFGMGRIGQKTAEKFFKAHNMEVIYCARHEKDLSWAKKVKWEELLERSDVLSIHAPLNNETRDLFNYEAFKKMKKGAIFINTSRGEIQSDDDLHRALKEGHLYGAGIDVTNPEPISIDHPLLGLGQCLITPHIGSATFIAREAMARLAAENILAGLSGNALPNGVSN